MSVSGRLTIISSSSDVGFASNLAKHLGTEPGYCSVRKNVNGDVIVDVCESVRNSDVYIVQTNYSSNGSINDGLLELLYLIRTCKSKSAAKITAVVPCFPYSRQDRKNGVRAHITAKLVARLMETAGADHIITMDLHAPQIQGFFGIPVDILVAESALMEAVRREVFDMDNSVFVTPDAGGTKRCISMAQKFNRPVALIHKGTKKKRAQQGKQMFLVGNVSGKEAIIIDDMADTCGTILEAVKTLSTHGARRIHAAIVHSVFSRQAVDRLMESLLYTIIYTNSIPLEFNLSHFSGKPDRPKFISADVSSVFAECVGKNRNEATTFPYFPKQGE